MKRFILSMTMLLCIALSSMAMSYEQARDRALFLTDKMAYELNLNDEQYEAAYEVNLDYLMSINTYDDLYGTYWTRRNLDLSYILLDWQYNAYCAAAYFYRPLAWTDGVWRFGIYARYPNRTYFYFGRPGFYATYYGGHSWHMNGGRSWYHGRTFGPRPGESRFGMRDRYDRGDFSGPRGDNRYDRNDNNRYDRNNNGRYDRNDNNRYDRNNNRYDRNNNRYDRNNNGRYDRNNNNSGYRGSSSTTTSTPNRGTSTSSATSRPQNDNQSNRGNGGNSGYRGGNNRSDNYSTDRSSTRMTVNRDVRNQVSRSSANVERTSPSTSARSSMGGSTSVSRQTSAPSRPASTFSPGGSRGSQSSAPRSTGGGRSGGGGSFGGRR